MEDRGYNHIDDFRDYRIQERTTGVPRGKLLGFRGFQEAFSIMEGNVTWLYGAPASGKTIFKYEILRQLTEFYGWNHLVADPETGTVQTVSSHIVKTLAGKDLGKQYNNQMSIGEQAEAETKANEHFYLLDVMYTKRTVEDLFDEALRIQDKKKKKIHTISIDPWNYLAHDKAKYGGRDDTYLEEILAYIIRRSMKEKFHTIVVTHPRDQQQRSIKVDGIMRYYYPPVSPRELAGGQVWFRMGMGMLSIWRPPRWWQNPIDDEHNPFEIVKKNEAHVFFQKKKPEGVSAQGDLTEMAKLYWDAKNRRYYELDDIGSQLYASLKKDDKLTLPVNSEFDDL